MPLQHLRSSTANKRPTPASMSDGQLAINTNLASPGLFFKDSNGALVKVGPVHVGTTAPNASPAVGGQAGNSVGEQWLDTSSSRYVFKVWDGTAWRSESGEFVDASGDVMTGALGIIAGSAGAPGLYFSGDTNTGIFSAGADTLAISTGGVAALQILNDGGLFVGRPTGDARVEIGGGATGNRTAYIDLIGDTTNADYGLRIQRGETGVNATSLIANKGSGSVVLRTEGAGPLIFDTNNAERLRIDSSGNVGIGTSSPDLRLTIQEASTGSCINLLSSDGNPGGRIGTSGEATTSNGLILNANRGSGSIQLQVASIERARIDSTGRLLVGATAMPAGNFGGFGNNYIQVFNSSSIASYAALSTINDYFGSNLFLGKARSTSAGIVQNNDIVGQIVFAAADGVDHASAAGVISCRIDGTPGADDTPGRLIFSTTADGASSPTERLRIDSSGRVGIGTSSPGTTLDINGVSRCRGLSISGTGVTSGTSAFDVGTISSDINWGMHFRANSSPSAAEFAWVNGAGSERLRIDISGNVGIGTTTPGAQLHLYEATAASFRLQQASCTFNSYVASGDYTCGTITNHPFVFTTNNAERVRITAGGSIGIGTSLPNYPLHIASGAVGVTSFTNSVDGASEVGLLLRGTSGSHNTSLLFSSSNTNFRTRQYFNVVDGSLRFDTSSDGATFTERFRIDSSGNASFAGTGALKLHAGTTAERPGTPTTGMVRYNSSITQFEGYNGSAWGTIGGGAKGAGSDQVFFENDQTVTTSYTITAGKNAMSAGPVTIGSGVTVTVPSGSVWVVV